MIQDLQVSNLDISNIEVTKAISIEELVTYLGGINAIDLIFAAISRKQFNKYGRSNLKYQAREQSGCLYFEVLHKGTNELLGWALAEELNGVVSM